MASRPERERLLSPMDHRCISMVVIARRLRRNLDEVLVPGQKSLRPRFFRGRAGFASRGAVAGQGPSLVAEGQQQLAFDQFEASARQASAQSAQKVEVFPGPEASKLDGGVLTAGKLQVLEEGLLFTPVFLKFFGFTIRVFLHLQLSDRAAASERQQAKCGDLPASH